MTTLKRFAPAAYVVLLFGVNAYICRELFAVDYTGHTNSIQGLWITMARLAGEHWFLPSWWPYQDAGMPFEHTYMPLLPALTALLAKASQWSPARAFNAVTGLFYCLGPVTLFLMAWGMTRAPGYAFWAALAYSLTSPARALIRDPSFNPSFLWTSRRLYTMAVWDDVPHGAAVCFLAVVLLFLWWSLQKRRPFYYLLTGVFMAIAVAASVFGAVAIVLSGVCLLAALPKGQLRANLAITAAIGVGAYLVISPFLPPSLLATIRANQQMYPEDQWSARSFTTLLMVAAGWLAVWRVLLRTTRDAALRFFVLFAYLASAIPLLDTYADRHFLPQSGRYQPEMEMAIALAFVFLLRPLAERLPRKIQAGLAFFLLAIAVEQVASHRAYAADTLRAADMTKSIEYRVAQWVDANMPGQRVMVPGSIAQWFNVFSPTPQLSGASYSTTPNWAQQQAMVSVLSDKGPEASLLWLKAFGVHAVTVCGPKSREFWKPYGNPQKFEGILPVLWREDDTTIYRVPQRTASLAHVIPEGAEARGAPYTTIPPSELQRYVGALDDPSLPEAKMAWEGNRRIRIETWARAGQAVSVQSGYHPGWQASANGSPAPITRDGLGFLLIHPKCDGPCEIELTYRGGWEYWLCRLCATGILACVAFRLRYFTQQA